LAYQRKSDFARGLVEGFYGKLKDENLQKSSAAEAFGLIRAGDPQLAAYLTYRFPHIRRVNRMAPNRDKAVFHDGLQLGQKLIISKGITAIRESSRLIIYDETKA
jgi:hypothetical protein